MYTDDMRDWELEDLFWHVAAMGRIQVTTVAAMACVSLKVKGRRDLYRVVGKTLREALMKIANKMSEVL